MRTRGQNRSKFDQRFFEYTPGVPSHYIPPLSHAFCFCKSRAFARLTFIRGLSQSEASPPPPALASLARSAQRSPSGNTPRETHPSRDSSARLSLGGGVRGAVLRLRQASPTKRVRGQLRCPQDHSIPKPALHSPLLQMWYIHRLCWHCYLQRRHPIQTPQLRPRHSIPR